VDVPNKSPNLDEVITYMKNNTKEGNYILNDPNFKLPKSPKSPRTDEPMKPIILEYTKKMRQMQCQKKRNVILSLQKKHQEGHMTTACKSMKHQLPNKAVLLFMHSAVSIVS
jgi:hypothetical protein